jgi:hypothetical protein
VNFVSFVVDRRSVDYPGDVGENEFGTCLDPDSSGLGFAAFHCGPVAQLGARFHGMEEVVGSIPTRSTKSKTRINRTSQRYSTMRIRLT